MTSKRVTQIKQMPNAELRFQGCVVWYDQNDETYYISAPNRDTLESFTGEGIEWLMREFAPINRWQVYERSQAQPTAPVVDTPTPSQPAPTYEKRCTTAQYNAIHAHITRVTFYPDAHWLYNYTAKLLGRGVDRVSELSVSEASKLEVALSGIKINPLPAAYAGILAPANLSLCMVLKHHVFPDDSARAKLEYEETQRQTALRVSGGRVNSFKRLTEGEAVIYAREIERAAEAYRATVEVLPVYPNE